MNRRDSSDAKIRQANRRRQLLLLLHWMLRPLGYLEFTEVFKIELRSLPQLYEVPGYTIAQATADDIAEIAENIIRDQPAHVITTLWQKGHYCFVAKSNAKVVAYNWIAFRPVQEEEYLYEPQSNDVICINAFTAPGHRGRGLHYLLLLTMLHFAAASGKSTAYTGASLFNITSWKSHLRMGWDSYFTFGWFRPYFTLRRLPWRLRAERYPLHLNWQGHAWFQGVNSPSGVTTEI